MKQFVLTIEVDNAAFDGENKTLELARILREQADRIEDSGFGRERWANIRDTNGNIVGKAEIY